MSRRRSTRPRWPTVANDSEWKNVTRLEENSKLKVSSVYPGKLKLSEGAVFARLKVLPKDSAFEVKTPTGTVNRAPITARNAGHERQGSVGPGPAARMT